MQLFYSKIKFARGNINLVSLLILMSCLSSCAVYSTGFNCPDSKGARCAMLSEVDKRVDSGEIESVYLGKKCQGNACNKQMSNVPKKALNKIHKVKIEPIENEAYEYQDGENLYLK